MSKNNVVNYLFSPDHILKERYTSVSILNNSFLKKNGGIYAIIRKTTKKIYIGQTANFYNRFKDHLRRLRKKIHFNPHLQYTYNKYSESIFQFVIIEKINNNIDYANKREIFWISFFNSENWNLYNITVGGKNFNLLDSQKDKIQGSNHHSAKLNEEQVVEIISSNKPYLILAQKFNVSVTTIYGIKNNKVWTHIKGERIKRKEVYKGTNNTNHKLTEKNVKEIRKSILTYKKLAEKYNVATVTIQRIKYNTSWNHLEGEIVPPPRGQGERNGHAKLTDNQIYEIRASNNSNNILAKQYNVSQGTIQSIKSYRTWIHLKRRNKICQTKLLLQY